MKGYADSKYESIIDMPHHTSMTHERMSVNARAAQFASFAALSGYDEEISEAGRLTDERKELDEDKEFELSEKIRIIADNIDCTPDISVLEFCGDKKKSGGSYKCVSGKVRRVDEYARTVIFTDGTAVAMDNIYSIDGEIFSLM